MTYTLKRRAVVPPRDPANRQSIEQLKFAVDELSGAVGMTYDRAVRVGELVEAGVLQIQVDGSLGARPVAQNFRGPITVTGDLTVLGPVGINRGTDSADAVRDLSISNGPHWLGVHARLSAGSYNPLVQAGDKALLFTDGTIGTGALVLAPWANSAAGLRVTGNGDTTIAGSLALSGSARRILADFSSSPAIRTFLQTSVTNGVANVGVIPHGTGNIGIVAVFNSSDPANAGTLQLRMDPTLAILNSGKTGSGVLRDMSFQFDSVEKARLYTDGRFQVSGRVIGDSAQIGRWGTGSSYVGLFAGDMASGSEFMILAADLGSVDVNTYISARNTGAVRIRPSANTTSAETSFETAGAYFRTSLYQLTASGAAWARLPRIFVQSSDPGTAAQDFDLWVWTGFVRYRSAGAWVTAAT